MRAYLTELIGTFFLVLTIGLAVASGTPVAPIAIGAALMVMVYMGGHVSGAHYNPAVTLAIFLRGKLAGGEILPYWVAQISGALAGAGVVYYLRGEALVVAPGVEFSAIQALVAEILYTFALVIVILNVATSRKTENNSYYGLAIGATVAAGAFTVGPISGGAFNPAVGVGPILVQTLAGTGSLGNLWIYLVGPFAGAAAAAVVFRIQEDVAP